MRNVTGATDPGTGAAAIADGADTEVAEITTLADEGAKHFLVVNVPNVGLIPEFAEDDPSRAAFATQLSQTYDTDLAHGLAGLDLGAGATLTDFNLYDFNANILANANALGFTNTTDPCFSDTPTSAASSTGCSLANINSFLYWDDIHPTARVQAMWAAGFEAAVPESSTWAMLLLGFASLGYAGYRRGALARTAAA